MNHQNPSRKCLAAGSRIWTGARTSLPIEKLKSGMGILTVGGDGRLSLAPVLRVMQSEARSLLCVNGEIFCTPNHPLLLPEGRLIKASDLVRGMEVQTLWGRKRITSLELSPFGLYSVFDVVIPSGFVANGYVTFSKTQCEDLMRPYLTPLSHGPMVAA